MAHVLIVANQTLCSSELIAAVLVRNAAGDATFRLLAPATPLTRQELALRHSEHPGAVSGETGPVAVARMRLSQALAMLSDAGIETTGDVGDPNPFKAVMTAAQFHQVDEVIISTLPHKVSRWLASDLPQRVQRRLGVPVSHVEALRHLAPQPEAGAEAKTLS